MTKRAFGLGSRWEGAVKFGQERLQGGSDRLSVYFYACWSITLTHLIGRISSSSVLLQKPAAEMQTLCCVEVSVFLVSGGVTLARASIAGYRPLHKATSDLQVFT